MTAEWPDDSQGSWERDGHKAKNPGLVIGVSRIGWFEDIPLMTHPAELAAKRVQRVHNSADIRFVAVAKYSNPQGVTSEPGGVHGANRGYPPQCPSMIRLPDPPGNSSSTLGSTPNKDSFMTALLWILMSPCAIMAATLSTTSFFTVVSPAE